MPPLIAVLLSSKARRLDTLDITTSPRISVLGRRDQTSLIFLMEFTTYITDITSLVELGGAGEYKHDDVAFDRDATGTGKKTFEGTDGFEAFCDGNEIYAMIQEDSGSMLGERMFVTSALEHDKDGEELTYYL